MSMGGCSTRLFESFQRKPGRPTIPGNTQVLLGLKNLVITYLCCFLSERLVPVNDSCKTGVEILTKYLPVVTYNT